LITRSRCWAEAEKPKPIAMAKTARETLGKLVFIVFSPSILYSSLYHKNKVFTIDNFGYRDRRTPHRNFRQETERDKDSHYWYDHDEWFVRQVDAGFKELYGKKGNA
jgi:hypothetical protein